ncbi:MAG TPA: alpha/beta hydrolase [Candidatus Saccharimonadales bacterium]|nr:alpha/beta hydrolase [Candidatus Saccharimonadales bacterium]
MVFDIRGIGNTTSATKPYSTKLLAKDTSGLMDTLKIQNASILGYSLGKFTTQQFAITHPDKVSNIIIIAGSCGGIEGITKPQEFLDLQAVIMNERTNNVTVSTEELKGLVAGSLGSGWLKLRPESIDLPENISLQQMKPGLSSETMDNRADTGWNWEAQNWSGVCKQLAKVAKPTLVMTGTDDNDYMPHKNALIIASKVPGAWLIQIKDAGHAIVDQYPGKLGNIIQTFLSIVK